jgi:hypothetical protein
VSKEIWGSWSSSTRIVRVDRPSGDPRGHFTSTPDYRALARLPTHLLHDHWCAKEPGPHPNGVPWHRTPAKAARSGAPPLKWIGVARAFVTVAGDESRLLRAKLHACKRCAFRRFTASREQWPARMYTFCACRLEPCHTPAAAALTT